MKRMKQGDSSIKRHHIIAGIVIALSMASGMTYLAYYIPLFEQPSKKVGMAAVFAVTFFLVFLIVLGVYRRLYVKKDTSWWDLLAAFCTIIAFGSLVYIYAPLELFFTNRQEFWFDSSLACLAAGHLFLLSGMILSILLGGLLCISRKAYKVSWLILFALIIIIYVQGTLFASSLPPLDGVSIDWSQYRNHNIMTAVVAIVVLCGIVVAASKLSKEFLNKGAVIISSCLFLMLMSTLAVLFFSEDTIAKKGNMKATVHNELAMSDNRNFIIFLLDAVDSHSFWEVLENTPDYESIFADFTYYPNTVGAYSFTSRAIPQILSGEWYENEVPFEEYEIEALKNSPLFKELEEKQYSIGIYDEDLDMSMDIGMERFDNQEKISYDMAAWKDFLELYLSLGGVRYAPYKLKSECYDLLGARNQLLRDNSPGEEYFTSFHWRFYPKLMNECLTVEEQNNVFKFFHFEGAHVPFLYDADLKLIENSTYYGEIGGCITLMQSYLESLKSSGLYDNTAIIFMSDHGYWDETSGPDKAKELRMNPLLMVKGFDENHDFKVSKAPISYEDLPVAYDRILDGVQGEELFDAKEGDIRERRFLFYVYLKEDTMEEYTVKGDVWDPNAIQPTGKVLER